MQTRILISGAGGASTIDIIRTLKATGRYYVIALDAEPYSFGFELADSCYIVPYGRSPQFLKALEEIVGIEKPDYAVPLIDDELAAFHDVAGRLPVRVLCPTPQFCAMAVDKWLTYEALRANGLPVPDTCLATDLSQVRYPAVIKPRRATGSRGLAFLNTAHELTEYLADAPLPREDYVVQQRVEGKEFTVSAVVALGGPLLTAVPKESLVKRGMSMAAVTRKIPEIQELCRDVQEKLLANGPFNLQLFLTSDGKPQILEINPRFSGSIPLTIAAGVHEVDLIIQYAEEKRPVPTVDFVPDLLMVRYHTQVFLPESQWRSILGGRDRRGTHAGTGNDV